MARTKLPKYDVSGFTVDQILNIDPSELNKMNRRQLSAITSRLVSAANKRIRRLQNDPYGSVSPSLQRIKQRGGQFSVKGKNLQALRNEFKQIKQFMGMKTSTLEGWKKTRKYVSEKLGGELTPDQTSKFWKVYHDLESNEGGLLEIIKDSEMIQKMLHQEVTVSADINTNVIFDKMMENLDDLYEDIISGKIKKQDPSESVSDVFSTGWF